MITADLLLVNAYVMTFDDDHTIISDGAVAVKDGAIIDVGTSAELRERITAKETKNVDGNVIMPGLIDTHMHTAQSLMRGLMGTLAARGPMRLPGWRNYLIPFEQALTEEDVELSGLFAYTTMLQGGTTTFFEAGGPRPEQMASAAYATGIRGIVSQSTMDSGEQIPDSAMMTTDEAIARNIEVVEKIGTDPTGVDTVTGCMSLRQIITCTPELIKAVHTEAAARGVKVHTHLVEGTYEIDFAVEKFGKRPVEYLESLGVFDHTLHGAHSIFASDSDVQKYADAQVSVAHCAKGNYSGGPTPALRMWRRGVPIGLGTDGVGGLGSLDLYRVGFITRIAQQLIEGTPYHFGNAVQREEPLTMGTRGGARAIGMGDVLGSIEAGKRADFVILRLDTMDGSVYSSPEMFVYECASGHDVKDVYVNGMQVVKDSESTMVDVEEIRAKAAARQQELLDVIA